MSKKVSFECNIEDIDLLHSEIERYKEVHAAQELKERKVEREDILDAVERNILCFDKDALDGTFTNKLLLIMVNVALINRDRANPPITDYHIWLPDLEDYKEMEQYYEKELLSEYSINANSIFEEDGASYYMNKNKLAVMICNNGEVLLGVY